MNALMALGIVIWSISLVLAYKVVGKQGFWNLFSYKNMMWLLVNITVVLFVILKILNPTPFSYTNAFWFVVVVLLNFSLFISSKKEGA